MKKIRVAINGFGRIGRLLMRVWMERINNDYESKIEIVAINAAGSSGALSPENVRYALKYDSNYGVLNKVFYYGTMEDDPVIRYGEDFISILQGKETIERKIKILGENNTEKIPWGDLGVDIVVDASGQCNNKEAAERHLRAGAKKVIVSAPFKRAKDIESIPHIVMGVNQDIYNASSHHIISSASCTTNALAPMLLPLADQFGIKKAMLTTVHAFTGDQKLVDAKHQDARRSRRAIDNIILTSTGAAKTIYLIIPSLKNGEIQIIDGVSFRVSTPTCSVLDLVVEFNRNPSSEEILNMYKLYANLKLRGTLTVIEDPIVSLDFLQSPFAVGIDKHIIVSGGAGSRLYKIIGYYDNEWGYATQMIKLIEYISSN